MKTPRRVPYREFMDELKATAFKPNPRLCPSCGKETMVQRQAMISFHHLEFGDLCTGSGRCLPMAIPFCPDCEEVPDPSGCLHIPMGTGL